MKTSNDIIKKVSKDLDISEKRARDVYNFFVEELHDAAKSKDTFAFKYRFGIFYFSIRYRPFYKTNKFFMSKARRLVKILDTLPYNEYKRKRHLKRTIAETYIKKMYKRGLHIPYTFDGLDILYTIIEEKNKKDGY
jgi:nucleoid DNA-binding protein